MFTKAVMGFQVTGVPRPWMSCGEPDMEPAALRGPAIGSPTLSSDNLRPLEPSALPAGSYSQIPQGYGSAWPGLGLGESHWVPRCFRLPSAVLGRASLDCTCHLQDADYLKSDKSHIAALLRRATEECTSPARVTP